MKRAIVMGAVIMGMCSSGAFAVDIKLGVVSLQKCFEEYYKTKQADSTLKDAADAYNKERQQLIAEFQKLQEERNKLVEEIAKPELSAAAKAEKQKEADNKLTELRKQKESIDKFDSVRRQQLQDQSNRMRGGIVKEITEQVVKIAKSQNYTLVIDSSGASMNATTFLVYAEDRLDITVDVIRELNKNAPPMEPSKPSGGSSSTNSPAKSAAPEAVPTPK